MFVSLSIWLLDLCFQRNGKPDLDKSNSVSQECLFLNLQQIPFIKIDKLYIMNSKIY